MVAQRPSWARRAWPAGVVAALALALVAGCGPQGTKWQGGPGGGSSPTAAAGPSSLTLTPVADAKNVAPAAPVKVEVANGQLDTVSLTNAEGKVVAGEFDPTKASWTNTQVLGYNKTYKLTAAGVGTDGQRLEQSISFTTVKVSQSKIADVYLRANLFTLLDGKTFGVGQPLVVWFDQPVKDRAEAQRTLTVTTTPQVEGVWHWFDSHELHWRPQNYWPANTKVSLDAKIYGHDFGNGIWGGDDKAASFTIGRERKLVIDANTQRMKAYVDGQQVTTIAGKDVTNGAPIATGKGQKEGGVDFRTYSGMHVMMERHNVKEMRSCNSDGTGICDPSSPNYYVSDIKLAIRISYSGEFVHLRDWDVTRVGKVGSGGYPTYGSHGCVNVLAPYIQWIWDNFTSGDLVDVVNTGKQLDVRDGLGDWTMSWTDWTKGSAV